MRSLFSYPIVIAVALTGFIAAPSAVAQERYFLKINQPAENENYGPGANCVVAGVLQLPDSKTDRDSLILVVKVIRPSKQEFVIENSAIIKLHEIAKDSKVVGFTGNVTMPKEKGPYLLRVVCLDRNQKTYPKSLVASETLFINVKLK
jgi:hypothetical protein